MEVVLIEGDKNTGKTTLCKMIEECLLNAGFVKECRERRPECKNENEQDFTAIYKKGACRIIINSESELGGIKRFKKMYDANLYSGYNVLISAIRPITTNKNLNKWIKDIYIGASNVSLSEHKIDLDSKSRVSNFCDLILSVLVTDGARIFNDIKTNLKCELEINCKFIK